MEKLDIVIPVLNEENSVNALVNRIAKSMGSHGIDYKIIFIDDRSTDNTVAEIKKAALDYPVTYQVKKGPRGKAYSIIEGIELASTEYVAMIDGDLQYEPEAIARMYEMAIHDKLGVVVARRCREDKGRIRTFVSKANRFITGKMITGFSCDTQSGLKVFKRDIVSHIDENQIYGWAFDIPLLHTARELGYKIGSLDTIFEERKDGKSKVNIAKAASEILIGALKVKLAKRKTYHLPATEEGSMRGAGTAYKRKRFITHTTLKHAYSAVETFTFWQKTAIISAILVLLSGFIFLPYATAVAFIALLSAVYFADVFFNLYLVLKSLHFPPELAFDETQISALKDKDLPVYSILCPLYHEAHVLPQFVEAIEALDWPKNKLDVLLLLEEDDKATIQAARAMDLPKYMRIIEVPDSEPKTKPKACNYGLSFVEGEYVVIYDAEDRPEADQLKKAYLGFKKLGDKVSCLQAKLNYYNPHQNILTRLFTAEYSLWFDVVLPALQTINTSIPLGGTSNHFRKSELIKFEGWDPFNVTEDADLGIRLFKAGGKTAIIDSTTLEEANSKLKNWIRQRSRWLKGYMQTYFVHMRNPLAFAKKHKQHWVVFQLVTGLRVTFMMINPILWTMTLAYFLLYRFVGPAIESLYPSVVFYMAVTSAIFGNFLYLYYYMIGAAKRGQYSVIKFIFFIPFYWIFTSVAAFVAFYQLLFKPYFWEKTHHGLFNAGLKVAKNIEDQLEEELGEKEKIAAKRLFNFKLPDLGLVRIGNIRSLVKKEYLSGAFLIAASMIANVLNFLYNTYLGRRVELENFALIALVGSFTYITQIPLDALSRTVTQKSAFLLGKYDKPVREFWIKIRKNSLTVSVVLAGLWIVFTPLLTEIFKSDTVIPFLIFVPVWIFGFAGAVDNGYLRGNLLFVVGGVMALVAAIVKLLLSIAFVEMDLEGLVYIAIPVSMFLSFLVGWYFANKVKGTKANIVELSDQNFSFKFFFSSIINNLSTIAFLSLDIVVAKLFLSPEDAGRYALLSLVGKMIFFVGSLFTQFITPLISRREASEGKSERTFYKVLFFTALSTFGAFIFLGAFGSYTAPLLFGVKILPVTIFLPVYTIAMVFQTLASGIVLYHQTKDRHSFTIVGFMFSIAQVVAMLLIHRNIADFVYVMFFTGVFYFAATIAMHIFYDQLAVIMRNGLDLLGLLAPDSKLIPEKTEGKLRILIFNWRDTKHKWAGGAEVYIHELAKRWVAMGHKVTVFSGNDGKSPRNENIEGVQVVRRGGFFTVYFWAFLYYTLRFKGLFDIIIDSENGIPFFTPLYSKEKKFLLIHHVHQDLFHVTLKPPLSWAGAFLEKTLMPYVYKHTEVITVSPSSKADILDHHLTTKDPQVIYNGVDLKKYTPGVKSKIPMVLYVGRIRTQKSLHILVYAARKVLESIPKVKFVIAGDGQESEMLKKLIKKLGLEDKIELTGHVDEKQKLSLYQKAWVFVNPSLMEGWGITTIEANACGTPVIASNVPGLRDAVHNPHSGLLVPYGDVDEFAKNIEDLIKDTKTRNIMSKESIDWAKKFDWDKSAREAMEVLYGRGVTK